MTDHISAQQFHETAGVDDWRALLYFNGACANFQTGSFAKGVELVTAIGQVADSANHHPDVDLRYGEVTVRLTSHDIGGLSERDADLARQISEAARELGVTSDPTAVQEVNVTIDALRISDVLPFWHAVLGYRKVGDEDVVDPHSHGPSVWFQQMDVPRPQRNRVHLDISVPHDQAEARVAAALEAGGRLVTDEFAPSWWVLADAEGNEACIATWVGRE